MERTAKKQYTEPTLDKREALTEVTEGAPLPISLVEV